MLNAVLDRNLAVDQAAEVLEVNSRVAEKLPRAGFLPAVWILAVERRWACALNDKPPGFGFVLRLSIGPGSPRRRPRAAGGASPAALTALTTEGLADGAYNGRGRGISCSSGRRAGRRRGGGPHGYRAILLRGVSLRFMDAD